MWWFPTIYEKFFLDTDDGFLRATRLPLGSDAGLDSAEFMQVYFLDTGESFIIQKPYDEFHQNTFEMPEELKQVPALAVKCRLSEILVEDETSSDSLFLFDNLYRRLTFEVVAVGYDCLTVNVLPYDDSQSDEEDEMKSEVSSSVDKSDEIVIQFTPAEVGAVTKKLMTPAELEIWDEEPLNTDNAQIAVQGFQTHDDDRRCKFYDPAIGGCFKGGRCKQLHLSEITDGTCRDRKELFYCNILEQLPLPALLMNVKIEITSFTSVNKFWCRYIKLKPTRDGYSLETLINHMNQPDEVKTFTQLKEIPSVQQLVLVKSDGQFHRGCVESLPDDKMNVPVWLVDFGVVEVTSSKNLYHWCTKFNYLAFQSLQMEIANIQPFEHDLEGCEAAMERMKEIIDDSKNCLKALIFDNVPTIRCTLFNLKGEDIGEELVSEGFLAARKIAPASTSKFIPG